VIGVPCPWQTQANLRAELDSGFQRVDVAVDPSYMCPQDINREIIRSLQLGLSDDVDAVVHARATEWVGAQYADRLAAVWKAADRAVQSTPASHLYTWLGFTWYRFWARPFVPDIDAIPEADRRYYEQHMLSLFNNPHNVDLGADMLWEIHGIDECTAKVQQFDTQVWEPLDEAVDLATVAARDAAAAAPDSAAAGYLADTRDRLLAHRCHCHTLRNVFGWIAGVHQYLQAEEESERSVHLEAVRHTVRDELENARALLRLWRESTVDFMPVCITENTHHYGPNLSELVEKKIALMETYGDRLPRIDPDYMWRVPADLGIAPEEYLSY
jgi:hypothetical protein